MKDCVFCNIIKGEIPSYKVYEDKNYFAFLDIRPLNLGHTLVIPKKHFRFVDDDPNFGRYFEVAKRVGKAIKRATGHNHLYYVTLGNMMDHAHIWIIPHFKGDGHRENIDWENVKKISDDKMKKTAEVIKKYI